MSFFDSFLDRSVVFSFDKTGFKRHSRAFSRADIERDLTGLHVVITGANSGIGFATAEGLVSQNATVTLVCRNQERGEEAIATLQRRFSEADVRLELADMSLLADVRRLAGRIQTPVNALIHNAGNMVHALKHTAEGIELITALHVAGPYLLTRLLEDQLIAAGRSGTARVVFVATGGMYTQRLRNDELTNPSTPYDGTQHYAHTKRAQVVLAEKLNQELKHQGVSVHAMHPGWVDTPALRRAMPIFHRFTRPILRSAEQGADTLIWLSACRSEDIDRDFGFWFDRLRAPLHMSESTRGAEAEERALVARIDGWIRAATLVQTSGDD